MLNDLILSIFSLMMDKITPIQNIEQMPKKNKNSLKNNNKTNYHRSKLNKPIVSPTNIKNKRNKRIKLPYILRNKICSQQEWKCNLCHNILQDIWIIDHIVPLCLGGTNMLNNLQSLCSSCNNFKTAYLDYRILKPIKDKGEELTPIKVLNIQYQEYYNFHDKDKSFTNNNNVNITIKQNSNIIVKENSQGLKISFDNFDINIIKK